MNFIIIHNVLVALVLFKLISIVADIADWAVTHLISYLRTKRDEGEDVLDSELTQSYTLPSGLKVEIAKAHARHLFAAQIEQAQHRHMLLPAIYCQLISIDGKKMTYNQLMDLSLKDGFFIQTIIKPQL